MIKCENDSLISSPFSVIHDPFTVLKARSNLLLLVEEESIKQYRFPNFEPIKSILQFTDVCRRSEHATTLNSYKFRWTK